ncbi:MAG: MrtC family glutamic-type intramembrane protease [Polyangiales bacterium]
MAYAPASVPRVLFVYAFTCVAVFGATRLEPVPVIGEYVHLLVAAVFLLTAIHMAQGDNTHFGISLGGLLDPSDDDRSPGPLGLWDLGRALLGALPSAVREIGAAMAVAAVIFPLYALAYSWWHAPAEPFALTLPPALASTVLAQLVIVALPEEAFFRGFLQTALSDAEPRRIRLLGVELAPLAWVAQAVLFALVHLISEPHPARLAVLLPGLLFGWVRAWRGGVGAALTHHAMSNLYSEILARSWL